MELDIHHLEQIEVFSRHKNFAKAASELTISQPVLCQTIPVLEVQLGYKIFACNIREVPPTAFGKKGLELQQS